MSLLNNNHRYNQNLVWEVATLSWVAMLQPTTSGGGGGGAVTIADGADVAQGAVADVAWVSGNGTVISLLKKIASAGGSAVSIADGSNVVEGALADAAVVTDTSGTLSGKLRGLVKMFASVWDSANGRLKVDGSAVTQPVQGSNFDGIIGAAPLSPVTVGGHYLATQPVYSDDAITSFGSTQRGALVVAPGVEGFSISAAALPLPTGASTSALQTTGNTSVGSIDTKTPALGQALAAASTPVVLTAIQQTALTPPAAITGFALEAGHLATIDTKTPALGQALAAASTPVVLTAAQLSTLTPLTSVAVTGPLTDTQLRATDVNVDLQTIRGNPVSIFAAGTLGTVVLDSTGSPFNSTTSAQTYAESSFPTRQCVSSTGSQTVGGPGGAGIEVPMAQIGASSLSLSVAGTFTGLQVSVVGAQTTGGGGYTVLLPYRNVSTGTLSSGIITTSGRYLFPAQAYTVVDISVVLSTGSVDLSWTAGAGSTDAWPAQLGDGTNGPVAVKAASTSAAATDPALVVRTVQLPTALAANGGMKIEGVASGVAVPVSGTVAVTSAGLTNLDVALSTRTKPADQQHTIIDSGTTVVTQPTGTNLHVVVDSVPTTAVTGPLTDTQLRATSVPVTATLVGITVDPTGNISTESYNIYRLQEKQFIADLMVQFQTALDREQYTSQAMGFELR